MEPADPISNDDISKSVVLIQVNLPNSLYTMGFAGIIVDWTEDAVCIISDACASVGNSIKVSSLSGIQLIPHGDFHIKDELAGIVCFPHSKFLNRMNDLKEIKICERPLEMSEAVYAYEGISQVLTPGNVTRLFGRQFSHNCAVPSLAEFGSLVLNKAGELVGINFTFDYQLSPIKISSLVGTISSIQNALMPHNEFLDALN